MLKVNTNKASAAHALMRQIIDDNMATDQCQSAAAEEKPSKPADLGLKPSSSKTLSDSDDDVPLVEVLGLPGKNVNYGFTDSL